MQVKHGVKAQRCGERGWGLRLARFTVVAGCQGEQRRCCIALAGLQVAKDAVAWDGVHDWHEKNALRLVTESTEKILLPLLAASRRRGRKSSVQVPARHSPTVELHHAQDRVRVFLQ